MANKKKKSPHGKQKGKKVAPVIEEQDLERFAGSSDEEEEHNDKDHATNNKKQQSKPRKEPLVVVEHDADEESGNEDDDDDDVVKVKNKPLSKKKRKQHQTKDEDEDSNNNDDDDDSNMAEEPTVMVTNNESIVEDDVDPGEKMADVMAKILGTGLVTGTKASSVVLAKTVTPLQRLQQQEKEKEKALKQKRQANRERNLAALHIPLSVATTNSVGEGRVSITKELEQERFHRRVATRGVVALFNAIAQHQNATENDEETAKKSDSTKLTKHSFLDKIKSTAATIAGKATNVEEKLKIDVKGEGSKSTGKWDALKDDFMMNPKKNWDEESSEEEEENSDLEQPEDPMEKEDVEEPKQNKRRKVSARA